MCDRLKLGGWSAYTSRNLHNIPLVNRGSITKDVYDEEKKFAIAACLRTLVVHYGLP